MAGTHRPILHIDDDAQSRSVVRHALENAGHTVIDAANGLRGLEAALRNRPSLILLDESLPDFDGSAVAGALRNLPVLAAIPIVAFTALGPASAEPAHLAGYDGYIDTPIDVERFADQVSGLLEHRHEAPPATDVQALGERLLARLLREIEEAERRATRLERLAVENARLYERERTRAQDLEVRNRHKDEFLTLLGHELRAPLAPILSAMALLADRPTDELVRRAREIVERQVRYQADLLDDLLDLRRIAHGKLELRREVVDLGSVTAAALEVTRPAMQERAQTQSLTLPVADQPLMVAADPVRLEQVVINLLANAAKYTPVGGAISLALARDGDTAVLRVRDSGEGIPSELLDRVFDPFVQASTGAVRSRPGGLGIGLALARRLIEMHGGTIEARSAGRGQGSEFSVRLPLSDVPASTSAPVRATLPEPEGKPVHVLIVEDDADTREMLRLALTLAGHRVNAAGSGREAIETAAAVHPEVMLVDLGLPDVDGHEVAREIRATLGGDVFLVALTGYGRLEDIREAEAAGFDAHVLKPATVESLARVFAQRGRANPF